MNKNLSYLFHLFFNVKLTLQEGKISIIFFMF